LLISLWIKDIGSKSAIQISEG